MMTNKKPYLSVSQQSTLEKCGMQYYWRYVEGLRIAPGIALIKGTGVHAAHERDCKVKVEKGGLLPLDVVQDIARDAIDHEWDENGVRLADDEVEKGEKAVRGELVDSAVRLVKLDHEELVPTLNPLHLERKFRLVLDGFPYDIEGRLDLQEENGVVRDLKTTGKTPVADAADKSLQLTCYSLARHVIDAGTFDAQPLILDHLVGLKSSNKYVSQVTTRGPADWQMFARRIEHTAKVIQSGAFMPCPVDSWVCCDKWCGYWKDTCPFGRRGRTRNG